MDTVLADHVLTVSGGDDDAGGTEAVAVEGSVFGECSKFYAEATVTPVWEG